MSNAKETKVEDHDYSLQPVPQFARRRLLTMFMIMLGFTFFQPVCGRDRRWVTALICPALSVP